MLRISCLAAVASLVLAGAAHAGYIPPLDAEETCNEPNAAYNNLADASAIFDDYSTKRCLALCKHAVADCKQYVKDATNCRLALESDFLFYQTQGCEEFNSPENAKLCKSLAREDAAGEKDDLRSLRDGYLEACEGWGVTCQASCPEDM